MKYTKEEAEFIAKSMYKAVHKTIKKALGTSTSKIRQKAHGDTGKDAVADLMDPNFIAEAKDKVPPKRTAQMNKSNRAGKRHNQDVSEGKKSKWQAKYKEKRTKEKGVHLPDRDFNRYVDKKKNKPGQSESGSYVKGNKRRATSDWGAVSNRENNSDVRDQHRKVISEQRRMKKPNLPKSEVDFVKSEKGINKLKKFIKNTHK
jgi:hypothetical protein